MAGEVAQEAIVLALGGAGIGAGGAVLAQIVAAIFTGRRESRRLRWDQEQVFRDEKREAFVSFLRLIELRSGLFGDAVYGAEEDVASAVKKIGTTKDDWWDEFVAKSAEFDLIAADLLPTVAALGALFAEWHYETWSDGPPTGEFYDQLAGRYAVLKQELECQMRVSLGIDVHVKKVKSKAKAVK